MKKCGDCIHADVCERIPIYTEFNRNNPAYCNGFQDKVDYVEVVRCKDCKFRIDDINFVRGHYCMKRPSNGGYYCEDDDFCSYGERKDNVI